jgi:hypothetical protein
VKILEETGNACNILIGKFQRKGLLVRPRYSWGDIMKMDSRGIMGMSKRTNFCMFCINHPLRAYDSHQSFWTLFSTSPYGAMIGHSYPLSPTSFTPWLWPTTYLGLHIPEIEVLCSSKMLVPAYQITKCLIADDHNLNLQCHENLKSCVGFMWFMITFHGSHWFWWC